MGTWLDLDLVHQAKAEALLFQSAEERYRGLLVHIADRANRALLGHVASHLGIQGPSLSCARAHRGSAKKALWPPGAPGTGRGPRPKSCGGPRQLFGPAGAFCWRFLAVPSFRFAMHRPRPSASFGTTGLAVFFIAVALIGLRACEQAAAPVAPIPAARTAP